MTYHIVCEKSEKYEVLENLRKCGITGEPSGYGDKIYIAIDCTPEQADAYEKLIAE